SAGGDVAISDERGAFALDLSGRVLPRLVAVARGYQPATFVPAAAAGGAVCWPERVVLQLGGAPLQLSGRVLDRERRPAAGAKVWVADPLYVGHEGGDALLAETLLGRDDRPFWAFALAGADGRFELGGLLDRGYELCALDPHSLVETRLPGVRAGARYV